MASWLLTSRVRRYALRWAILDVPTARSSHSVATPRGGGLAIASVVGAAIAGLAVAEVIEPRLAVALLGGGAMVVTIGWMDDRRPQPVWLRAMLQLAASAWAVSWLGGLPTLHAGPNVLRLGAAGGVLATLAIAWGINLYNFMDGIDGLAAGQAVVAGLVGALLLTRDGSPGLAGVSATTAGAALGFLAWNWSPARIFMGDVGSGPLGFLFATIGVASDRGGDSPLPVWLLLLGLFVFDATVTLVRRMVRGDRWYAAHRLHAYQRAVQSGWSHRQVTIGALFLMMVLGALAITAAWHPDWTWRCVGVALAVLAACYLWIEFRRPMAAEGR
ncbi:MAG TPA: glycosyltransferase family 4 protein [Gemmatimonadales bacterium]|nr:glycosyltransferase family 4 protein [Gemmatimonadales bacterium]